MYAEKERKKDPNSSGIDPGAKVLEDGTYPTFLEGGERQKSTLSRGGMDEAIS